MRLCLINPSNPLVSIVRVKANRWNRYRVWKPLNLLVLAGLTPRAWEISILDENLGVPDYPALPRPDLGGIHATTCVDEVMERGAGFECVSYACCEASGARALIPEGLNRDRRSDRWRSSHRRPRAASIGYRPSSAARGGRRGPRTTAREGAVPTGALARALWSALRA